MRSPPRWTKWSRGVRTRGLRVGAVGGPRPLFLYDALLLIDITMGWLQRSRRKFQLWLYAGRRKSGSTSESTAVLGFATTKFCDRPKRIRIKGRLYMSVVETFLCVASNWPRE